MHLSSSVISFFLLVAMAQGHPGLRGQSAVPVENQDEIIVKRKLPIVPDEEGVKQDPATLSLIVASPMVLQDYSYDEEAHEVSFTPSASPAGDQNFKGSNQIQSEERMDLSERLWTQNANDASGVVQTGENKTHSPVPLFQGDIIPDYELIMNEYGPDTLQKLEEAGMPLQPTRSSGVTSKNLQVNRRWTTRVGDVVQIPYSISSSFNRAQQNQIQQAITDLAQRSGVVAFVPRTSERDYVAVITGSGCSSFVGKQGGGQRLTLSIPGCMTKGIIQHEFLHALGFEHEQSRPDRDTFVTVNLQNVQPGKELNFDKATSSNSLESPYDYGSVMHYGATDFTRNGQETISAPQRIGQRERADTEDIFQVQLLYQCASRARTTSEFTANPCTRDCKCWEGASGCNSDDNACQGSLVCSSNKCVKPGGNGGGVADNFWEFRNQEDSNLCLDVRNGDTRNGNLILLSTCNGSQSQKFAVDRDGRIMSAINLGKCLVGDSGATSRGTQLWIHDCFANDTRFQFFRYTSGRIRPARDTNQCVGPSRSKTDGGSPVVQFWDCYNSKHQQWNWG